MTHACTVLVRHGVSYVIALEPSPLLTSEPVPQLWYFYFDGSRLVFVSPLPCSRQQQQHLVQCRLSACVSDVSIMSRKANLVEREREREKEDTGRIAKERQRDTRENDPTTHLHCCHLYVTEPTTRTQQSLLYVRNISPRKEPQKFKYVHHTISSYSRTQFLYITGDAHSWKSLTELNCHKNNQ